MTLWWSKHLYSPYDLFMDRTYNEGVLQMVAETNSQSQRRAVLATNDDGKPTRRYAFHTRYVHDIDHDIDHVLEGITRPKDKIRRLTQMIDDDPYLVDNAWIMRERGDTIYVVPPSGSKKNPLLRLARLTVLVAVDKLIGIEETNNAPLRTKTKTTR